MDPLLKRARELLEGGRSAERSGLYFIATTRYGQVLATLQNRRILHDSGEMPLSQKDELLLVALHEELSIRLRSMIGKMGNGKHSLGSGSKDSPRDAAQMLLEEAEAGL